MTVDINKLRDACVVRETRGAGAHDSYIVDVFNTEHFAKLIVQQCISAIAIEQDHWNSIEYAAAVRTIGRVREHFGILAHYSVVTVNNPL